MTAPTTTVPSPVVGNGLTVATLITFAAQHPDAAHAESTIIRELGVTPTRYAQLLGRAITHPEALEVDAITTHALIRRRDTARAQRSAIIRATNAPTS